jgi:hypothetical protein
MAGALTTYEQDGRQKKTTSTFFRGKDANFNPTDESLARRRFVENYLLKGLAPEAPFIEKGTTIVPFGSCFAANIENYLFQNDYNILTKQYPDAYVSSMGDGIVNTYAIRQQFEWAWDRKVPAMELWHGYKAEVFGYDEQVRRNTQDMFDQCDVFIITLGLAEVWYDKLTDLVFWRAVPQSKFDESRHKFRVTSVAENLENLHRIRQIIRQHRPHASIVFTLSPVPLTASFRNQSCIASNSASKAILRAALDEFMRSVGPAEATFYFPSYEIVTSCFMSPFMEDRKHPHAHVIDLNMAIFERYFCKNGPSDDTVDRTFANALRQDYEVARDGHFAVPRRMNPKAGGAVPRPGELKSPKSVGESFDAETSR